MAGRPTKYYPAFCDLVLECGAQGMWLSEMADECGVHRSTLDEWASVHPEFSEALTRAKQKAQAYFERAARDGMFRGGDFNAGLWKHQMAARHPDDYTDRSKVDANVKHKGIVRVIIGGENDTGR